MVLCEGDFLGCGDWLGSAPGVGLVIFRKEDRERLERIEGYCGNVAEWISVHVALLKRLEENDGKLLAAIHESEERELCRWQAVQNDHNNALNALSGQVKGLGDGLVDEIRQCQITKGILPKQEVVTEAKTKPWTYSQCGQINAHYSTECGRCEKPRRTARSRKRKRK